MEQPDRRVSKRTIVIGSARLIAFAIGVVLILALLVCFAAELIHFKENAVGKVFPRIVVLLVYDAGAMVLLRIALGLSLRRDRAS